MDGKMVGLLLAGVCALVVRGANNVLWTNATGNNLWSDAGNWRDNLKPVPGDTVYVSNSVANAQIVIDEQNVSVASIRFEGSQSPVVSGKKLTLTGTSFSMAIPDPRPSGSNNLRDYSRSVAPILGYYAGVTFNNDVEFASSGASGIIASYGDMVFNGVVTAPNATSITIHNGLTEEKSYNWNLKYGDRNSDITFNSPITAPNAVIQTTQAPSGKVTFNAAVTAKQVLASQWISTAFHFNAPVTVSNGILYLNYLANIHVGAANVFPANGILAPLLNQDTKGNASALSYYLAAYPQTIDRLAGDLFGKPYDKNMNVYGTSGSETLLTLKGTANATTALRVCDGVTVVWDPVGDYTQSFTGRVHTTTGALVVKRGTVKLLQGTSFANLASVTIAGGATLDDASDIAGSLASVGAVNLAAQATLKFGSQATAPFSAGKTELYLENGAHVDVPSDSVVSVKTAYLNGVPVAAGSYTSANCAWVTGAGSVSVNDVYSGTAWSNAAGGSWNDAANWTEGVPTSETSALVALYGDYTVALDAAFASQPGDVSVVNRHGTTTLSATAPVELSGGKRLTLDGGSKLVVPEGGAFVYDGASAAAAAATEVVTLKGGMSIEVTGGLCSFTNMTGLTMLGSAGDGGSTNRIRVTGGRFSFFRKGNATTGGSFRALPGSVLEATGGEVVFGSAVAGQWSVEAGNASYKFDQTYSGAATSRIVNASSGSMFVSTMGPGTIRFTDNACYTWSKGAGAGNFREDLRSSRSHPATLIFEGHARTLSALGNDGFYLRGTDEQPSTFIWGSDQTAIMANGFNLYNNGHLLVTNGVLKASSYGITVGSEAGNSSEVVVRGNGRLELNTNFRKQGIDGLILGYGCGTSTGTRHGEALLCENGVISNILKSAILVGAGHGASGVFRQTGGRLYSKNKDGVASQYPVLIGFAGGTGSWNMSGGEAYIANDVWIGGCPTNRFNMLFSNWSDQPVMTCPHYDGLGATGTLTVDGGSMTIDETTRVGVGDHGTIAVNGGELTTKNLILSNNVSSVLSFAPKGSTAGVLRVTEKLTVAPGAKLVVDASDFVPEKSLTPILAFASKEGDFAAADITFTAPERSRLTLIARPNDYAIYVARSTTLIFR